MALGQISQYPFGFKNGVTVRGMSVLNAHPGNVFWVSSVDGTNGDGSIQQPFTSVANALVYCTADKGDIIVAKAKHAETITAAGGVTISKNGVALVGLGKGSDRATFDFTTSTAATFLISGNAVTVEGCLFTVSLDQVVSPISVTGDDCYLDVTMRDTATNKEAVTGILATTVSRLRVNLKYEGQTGGSHCTVAVKLNGVSGANINLDAYGKFSTAAVNFVTVASTNVEVTGYVYNSGTTDGSKNVVDTITGSTWAADLFDGAAGAKFSGGSGASVYDASEKVCVTTAKVMVTGDTIFTVAGGPIMVVGLTSICITNNDGTASTLQYSATPTSGSAQTISGASASLAAAAAGASVTLAGTALATAALLNANGPNLIANPGTIMVPAGTIKTTIAVGSTTGTWKHFLRYRPLATGVTVTAGF